MECPFCGNSDQEKMRFFSEEGDRVHRVEVCDVCKAYLKVVDLRETERAVVLFVENLATIHLDLVAKREGFQRDTNRLFGL
jgi:FdhE protein